MILGRRISGALAALAMLTLPAAAPAADSRHLSEIAIANPEDLLLVDAEHVIVSSMAGGGRTTGALVLVDRRSGEQTILFPSAGGERARAAPGCGGPLPADAFQPHGIALHRDRNGGRELYVVNHGGRESIERFRLDMGPKPKLSWIGCTILPKGAMGNSVAVARDGSFFVTNLGQALNGPPKTEIFSGEVLSWKPGRGWTSVPGSTIEGANGLLLAPDESRLYVAAWNKSDIVSVPLNGTGEPARRTRLPFLPDNLRWSDRGTLFATGHATTWKAVADCYGSPQAKCPIPSAMAEIDPASLAVICTQDVAVDMATSTIVVGSEIWIGSARNGILERRTDPSCGVKP